MQALGLSGGEESRIVVSQFGPYRIEGLIARGGMGEVLRAHDVRHDRVIALKLLAPQLASDHEYRERFKREAHAAARLREPHVIPIHAFGEIEGRLYLDMRLVEGQDVSRLIQTHGPMSPSNAVDIIGQVAQALDAAHKEGLVHRDIKPSNILVSNGFAYLADFGIAYMTGGTTITSTGVTVGTIDYMAPERFGDAPIDHRCDVYSLACVLYQCLTASKPFPHDTTPALINAHLNREPPRPSAVRGTVPAALDEVIARGMAKSPEQRYATAGQLAQAARYALMTVQSGAEKQRFTRWWLPALVVLAVIPVVVLVTVFMLGRPTPVSIPMRSFDYSSAKPAGPLADLGLQSPMQSPECDRRYIVVVGAAFNKEAYQSDVQRFLEQFPGASYMYLPETGCGSSRTTVDGAGIYSIYYGPFDTEEEACTRQEAIGRDAYVKMLSADPADPNVIECE